MAKKLKKSKDSLARTKIEFVTLCVHQLRTPLAAIKWILRMVLDGELGRITKKQKEFLEKGYRSNERMISLVNDLLSVTRIEEGRYLFRPALVDIAKIVESVLDSCNKEIKQKKLQLDFRKDKDLPKLKIDLEQTKLAIRHLIDNAIRYTKAGGKISLSLKKEKGKIHFLIKDNGIGIPKDQQDQVFTRFFRGANAMRREIEGSGLGLFIVKNIIEVHQGKTWFESEENKGTTIHFTLPIA